MGKYCSKCGQELEADVEYCTNCGTAAEAQQEVEAQVEQPIQTATDFTKDEMVLKHRYSMAKFKKGLAIFMIISTAVAMIIGIVNIFKITGSYEKATEHAQSISYIESVGGKTLEEAYYQDYGDYLENEVVITYINTCILSGLYQTILFFSLFFWIYLFKKANLEKRLIEVTGQVE